MANINNIKTGNVNIPGALHSTANDGGGQVGNVVAYAGDIYDTTAGKNQATLNAEFAEGIANAGTGTGTITGATVGGAAVTESNGVLQFNAYPTANTMQYSSSTSYASGTIGKEVKDLNTSVSDLSAQVAELDKPSPTPSPSTTVVNLANYTASGSSFTYDVDNKYTYNTKDTTFYQYSEENNNTTVYYGVFKVIGEDRYLMYSITNNTTFTYVNTYTESTLPENAKKEFALGSVAVVKRVNGEGERWKNGTINLFCTKQNMALRNRCKNINFNGSTAWRVLIKSEDGNTIFVYKAKSNGNYEWEINVPRSSTANFNLLDKYFDRPEASNVSFDDSVAHLGTTLTSVDTVQKAINVIAVGVAGNIGKLIIRLLYPNSAPVTDKEVSITAYYRGNPFDLSTQYTPDFSGFKTDSNGYVVNADGGEFISLPLGATYTIHYTDISDSYLTPEDTTGVIDSSEKTISNIYQNVSENEFVYFYVQMPNVSPSVVTPVNKVINVDTYSTPTTHALAYKCILRENGTVKQILYADGTTQATYNGEPLISANDPVLLPISTGTKYLSSLQLWDPSLSENEQRYVKSSDIIYTASKAKRTVKFEYLDNQVGIFLIVADATTAKGYRACLVTSIDTTNNKILFKDGDYTYEAYLSNSVLYRKLENDVASEVWEETILGYGIKTSTTILNTNDDSATSSEYPNCSFIMPKNPTTLKGALTSTSVSINIPVNFGGLFVSTCYNELSGDTSSPLINRLLNDGEEAWSLTTSGGAKTIKGFAATLSQINVVKGVISQVSNINNILFGTTYTYAKTGVTAVHPITLVTNNGSESTSTGSEVANLVAATLNASNPRSMGAASTNLNIVVLYPFS